MTARDELATILSRVSNVRALHLELPASIVTHAMDGITDAVLAAGYRKPRTISTIEELETLPADAVIRTAAGLAYQCNSDGEVKWWVHPGEQRIFASRKLSLPATVLFEPVVAK